MQEYLLAKQPVFVCGNSLLIESEYAQRFIYWCDWSRCLKDSYPDLNRAWSLLWLKQQKEAIETSIDSGPLSKSQAFSHILDLIFRSRQKLCARNVAYCAG
jgi:hypothetical protein